MVSRTIYLEGGGESKELHSRCRKGFRRLLEQLSFQGRMPHLVACGSRSDVFDSFQTANATKNVGAYVAMWIDSEEPMADIEASWVHLHGVKTVPSWTKPINANDQQVLFMNTCMETWIVADRATIKQHYGKKFQESALPSLVDLELRLRGDVQAKLAHATRECANTFAKGKRSFEVLEKLSPAALMKSLPSFVRIVRILKEVL